MSYAIGQRVWARDKFQWVEAVISEKFDDHFKATTYEVWLYDYTHAEFEPTHIRPYFSHGLRPNERPQT